MSLPPALAVINPKQHGDPYPDKDLAGVGIAYKIAEALFSLLACDFRRSQTCSTSSPSAPSRTLPPSSARTAPSSAGTQTDPRDEAAGTVSLAGVAQIKIRQDQSRRHRLHARTAPQRLRAGWNRRLALLRTAHNDRFHARRSTRAAARSAEQASGRPSPNPCRRRLKQIALGEDPEAFLFFAAHEDFNSGVVGLTASQVDRESITARQLSPRKDRRDARLVPLHPRIPHHRRARSVQGPARPSRRSCRRGGFHGQE
ncbi:MAG: hypothetical protein MZU97_07410 [Bacillus subtilis]|nr:hypothetical protein [Bacillus subtilis]